MIDLPNEAKYRLSHRRLVELLCYDPATGNFVWRVDGGNKKRRAGKRAGYSHGKGYRRVTVEGEDIAEHRLAWFYMTGEWPTNQVDHRDLNKSNNAWSNLRSADNAGNQQNTYPRRNSKTGVKGVHVAPWGKYSWKYRAKIRGNGEERFLGYFDTLEEAAAAYAAAAKELHGEFARVA